MTNSSTCFPLIISESLSGGEIHQQLTRLEHAKLRTSSTVQRGSCIFPKSSIAFLLINNREIERLQLDRVEHFVRFHRFSYVLFQVQVMENYVIETISNINNRLFPDVCSVLFADTCASVVDLMIFTANAHLPATMELSNEAAANFFEKANSEEMAIKVLSGLDLLNVTDRDLVMNGCDNLAAVVGSCADEFGSMGLDVFKASELEKFFDEDYLLD